MKAAVVKGNSKVEIENFTISDVGSNELLIKMQSCGICGSDVEKVFGKYGQPSMKLGHEPAGDHHVACYSKDCHECSHGNETMCKKYYQSNLNPCGLADNYVVPEWNVLHGGVLKLPDNVSYQEAALIEPLACCVRAWSKFKYQKNDTVAVLGVGPTGMMHVLLAKSFGFSKIFCMDLNDFRLDFVRKFGVTTIRSDDSNLVQKVNDELSESDRGVFEAEETVQRRHRRHYETHGERHVGFHRIRGEHFARLGRVLPLRRRFSWNWFERTVGGVGVRK